MSRPYNLWEKGGWGGFSWKIVGAGFHARPRFNQLFPSAPINLPEYDSKGAALLDSPHHTGLAVLS